MFFSVSILSVRLVKMYTSNGKASPVAEIFREATGREEEGGGGGGGGVILRVILFRLGNIVSH